MIGRLGDVVCDPHHTCGGDKKHGFPNLASKLVVMNYQWFTLKTTTTVSWFGPQNQGRRFGGLDSKPLLRFCDLGLKINGRRFVGLCLKTDGRMKTV
jgi:hypothetical protein